MDDVFKHATKQVFREAPPELVAGFKEKMDFIKVRYKHNEKTVQSCLDGMSIPPTLLELLTAAYVVNGGLLFKHGPMIDEEEDSDRELNQLIRDIENLAGEEVTPPSLEDDTTDPFREEELEEGHLYGAESELAAPSLEGS
jgi:hypothetical protein